MPSDEGIVKSRGYLIHWDVPGATQFITWRLADSLPKHVIDQYHLDRDSPDPTIRKHAFRKVDLELDKGTGECLLAKSLAAREFICVLLETHNLDCFIRAFSIMPNHVHILVSLCQDVSLADVVKGIKGRSSRNINKVLNRKGTLWQPDYFDRMIRDQDHLNRTIEYIHWNPVKAKLCADPRQFTYSSANPQYAQLISLPD